MPEKRWFGFATVACLACLLQNPVGLAQSNAELEQRMEALEKGQQDIREQLEEIRKLLQDREPAVKGPVQVHRRSKANQPTGLVELRNNPVLGSADAPLTLVEFTDYQCPFCARHYLQTHPQLENQYIQTGKIRFVSLDLPVERTHPLAFKAAEAAHCAGDQDQFWEMRDRLFRNQRSLEPLTSHAEALGLDTAAFEMCLNGEKHRAAIISDRAQARRAGASGTPSFVLGKTAPGDPGKVRIIGTIRGAKPFQEFAAEIDRLLDETGK